MNTAKNTSKRSITETPAPMNLTGQFLIAMPTLHGDTFDRTVIYMCEHSASGALGLIVNRTADVKVSEILDKMAAENDSIAYQPSARADQAVLLGGQYKSSAASCCTRHFKSTPLPCASASAWA